MKSLRSRLIVGFALVALVPIAISIYLLSRRVETMVRTQSAERLNAALGELRIQLRSDEERIEGKLEILAKDPVLKRLYLLQPSGSRDLNEYLAERSYLLGLDQLQVVDGRGTIVADGSNPSAAAPSFTIAASALILYEKKVAGDLTGGIALDAAFLSRLKRTAGLELVLRDGAGQVVAATLDSTAAQHLPIQRSVERVALADRSYMSQSVPLEIAAQTHATVTGLISTAPADRTIATLQLASLFLGLLGLGIAILLGAFWSSQVSRPVERLAAYSRKLAQGEWDEPLNVQSIPELETLVQALERMRQDLTRYREKLVLSERHAAWGQMARKVAHEVKNPLTPIAISIADLKRSYELKRPDFPAILDQAVRTIAEEVDTLKRMLQEFSDFGRFPVPAFAPCRVSELLADLESLYGHDVADGRLRFTHAPREVTVSLDAAQIRQALVNLIKNGLEALNDGGRVTVSTEARGDGLEISVSDTGPGLSAQQRAQLFMPGFTTKIHGSGLGLTTVERIVNEHGGTVTVESPSDGGSPAGTKPAPAVGTTFRIRLPMVQRG